MIDHLRQIAVFAKTVETGSFRAAAEALRLSPSVVSHHISQLEAQLGVALLYRSTRRLSLTRDGERLFQSAQTMMAAAEDGIDAVSAQSRDPVGTLRITAPAVLATSFLIDDIAAFSAAFPKIGLALDFTDVRRDLISEGIDVSIRMGWLKDSSLKATKLHAVERKLVAATTYVKSKPAPRGPADLASWDWLHLSPVPLGLTLRDDDGRATTVKFKPRVSADDALALYRLARAGLGLAYVPEFLVEDDVADGTVQVVLPRWSLEPVGVYAVWPPNAPRGSLTARFVDFLKQRMRAKDTAAA